jgi:hypothetical protein
MSAQNLITLLARPLALLLCASTSGAATPGDAATCDVSKGPQRNDALRAQVPYDGKFVFKPGGPGFVDRDGALGIKFAWDRLVGGTLIVGGKRLDGDAPPARAYMNKGYGEIGFQATYLVFPTPGCWQITGQIGDRSLSFVVEVEKIGEGPAWKYDLPTGGFWYATQL